MESCLDPNNASANDGLPQPAAVAPRPSDICGYPTRYGDPCRRPVLGGGRRCHRHAGIPATEAERAASRKAALKHGYFASAFIDDDERALYERMVVKGAVDPWALKREVVGMLAVRAIRMMRWEREEGEGSTLTNTAFAELRQCLDKFGFHALLRDFDPEAAPQHPARAPVLAPEHREAIRQALEENGSLLGSLSDADRRKLREMIDEPSAA